MKATTKKIRTAAGILGGIAAAAAASAYVTAKLFAETALDREQPKVMKKAGKLISGGGDGGEFDEECAEASLRLQNKPHETVEITASDGCRLLGHFYPAENPERVIIAFHGWRSSWHKDFGAVSDFWAENGCSVLYVEQRGQNGSGGSHIGMGLTERFDCADWVDWATLRCGRQVPIYLAGLSMGATTVLMAAGLQLPPNVHGIMADCGFTSPHAIWKHVAEKNLHVPYGLRGVIAEALYRRKINMGAADYSTVAALKNTRIPVLLIHGAADKFVPVEMTYENYEACASPKKLFIVPGADHAMSYLKDREGYEKTVKDFWKEFD